MFGAHQIDSYFVGCLNLPMGPTESPEPRKGPRRWLEMLASLPGSSIPFAHPHAEFLIAWREKGDVNHGSGHRENELVGMSIRRWLFRAAPFVGFRSMGDS